MHSSFIEYLFLFIRSIGASNFRCHFSCECTNSPSYHNKRSWRCDSETKLRFESGWFVRVQLRNKQWHCGRPAGIPEKSWITIGGTGELLNLSSSWKILTSQLDHDIKFVQLTCCSIFDVLICYLFRRMSINYCCCDSGCPGIILLHGARWSLIHRELHRWWEWLPCIGEYILFADDWTSMN